jgi:hypothetical protein
MTHRGILGTLDLALLLLLPSLAQAQDRTSLSRIVEAICEKSDVDGDTFRPKLCSPRCDCDVSGATEAVSCTGSVPGAIVVEAQVPAHDSYCTGACITGITPDIVVLGPCASQSDCPVDSSCWFESVIFGTPPASCMDLTTSCNSSADCPAGYSCNTISRCIKDSGFSCPMEPPATAVVCDTVAASLRTRS